jgi:undecaprenyl-diphosphatase
MPLFKVIVLSIVQGFAELLPVSSSAHVVVAEKLLHLDPSAPQMTLLLVMLHTGTMFAVIVYFWKQWRRSYFASAETVKRVLLRLFWATLLTGIVGRGLQWVIERTLFHDEPRAEIEMLFSRLDLIAPALAAVGVRIRVAGLLERRLTASQREYYGGSVTMGQAGWMGLIQGVCLPFRGFSRSGATISTAMLAGAGKERAERFSFALAVILTPPVVAREAWRLVRAAHGTAAASIDLRASVLMSLLGAAFAFLAGLLALRWLSSWLEKGRWYLFGIYCLIAAGVVYFLYARGY